MTVDLTPEDIKILYLAAESFLGAGDPIGGDIEANLPVVLGLIAADPRFRAGVLAAYRAGREDAARDTERPDSPLCDCPRLESTPTNPLTKAAMDHHCDCRAVETAAIMLGAYSKTEHARQCSHGTEFDEFYQPRTPGEDVTP